MDSSNYRVRRATLDDLPHLTSLWQTMHFRTDELGKRVTEFQIAEGGDGKLVGAVALQIAERQGRVHSEGFSDFAVADQIRPLFWDRLQSVARNHGLLRLWTKERAPFWSHCGLQAADPEALQKLPALWRAEPTDWLTLKLKDEVEAVLSLDKEFAMFMESEKQRTQRAFQHARILKIIATLIALVVFVLVVMGAFLLFKKNPSLLRR